MPAEMTEWVPLMKTEEERFDEEGGEDAGSPQDKKGRAEQG
jgi:hypothetical protein